MPADGFGGKQNSKGSDKKNIVAGGKRFSAENVVWKTYLLV